MELVDILTPPKFTRNGIVKTRKEAAESGDWIGTFNLWIVQSKPTPSIIYQLRSAKSTWSPNKLGVVAGGHYQAGESIKDGLREVKEEIGKVYKFSDLTCLGKRLYVGLDEKGMEKKNVVDIFIIKDNSPLNSFALDQDEVRAICSCPISALLSIYKKKEAFFYATGLDYRGAKLTIKVSQKSFPYNWDNYHYKMVNIARRFLKNEKGLYY